MVFDKILDNRQLSKQAALDFIANNMQSNVWISVFTIDQRLYPATGVHAGSLSAEAGDLRGDQHDLGRGGVAGRAGGARRAACEGSEVDRRAGRGGRRADRRPAPGTRMPPPLAAPTSKRRWRRSSPSSLRFSDSIQRQQQGQSTLYPMLALVKAQSRLAGQQDADLLLGRTGRAQEPRGGIQDDDQRSQSRQRHRLRDRRTGPELGARFRGARDPSC